MLTSHLSLITSNFLLLTYCLGVMSFLSKVSLSLIKFYQTCLSPYLPPACRFTPTCSEYARQAFMKYNYFKAMFLSVKRILKCHPFHPGGYDPLN